MYLSRLLLNPMDRRVQRDLSDCHQLHRTVMSGFPETEGNPREEFKVLYRLEVRDRPALLVQSVVIPDWQALSNGYLIAPAETKSIAAQYERLSQGMVLRFRLAANPTKKIDTKSGPDGRRRNGRRVDLRTEEEQIDWLVRKGEQGGFSLLRLQGNPEVFDVVVRPQKVGGRGKHPNGRLTFSGVVFDGRLQVTDEGRFRDTLQNGIGSAKAFGYGLLSVAP